MLALARRECKPENRPERRVRPSSSRLTVRRGRCARGSRANGSARREDGDPSLEVPSSARPRARAQRGRATGAHHRGSATRTGRRSRRTATSCFVPLNRDEPHGRRCEGGATRSRSTIEIDDAIRVVEVHRRLRQSDEGAAEADLLRRPAISAESTRTTCSVLGVRAEARPHGDPTPARVERVASKCSPSNARRRR